MPRLSRRLQPNLDHVLIATFACVIAAPLVAFVFGVRGQDVENRARAQLPELSASRLFDTEVMEDVDTFLAESLPFRERLLEFDARVDLALGDSPNSRVVLGYDGWLFYRPALEQICIEGDMALLLADVFERSQRVFDAVDRRLVVVAAPDKASIYPEFLSDEPTCSLATAESVTQLDSSLGVVATWDALRSAKEEGLVFFKKDTHWNSRGAAIAAEIVVDRIVPGGSARGEMRELGQKIHEGDLTRFISLPSSETDVLYGGAVAGVVHEMSPGRVVGAGGIQLPIRETLYSTSGAPSVVGGSTLVMTDSFGVAIQAPLYPFFDDVAFVRQRSPRPAYMWERLLNADLTVRLTTQRSIFATVLRTDLAADYALAFRTELPEIAVREERSNDSLTLHVDDAKGDAYVFLELDDGIQQASVTVREDRTALPVRYNTFELTRDSPAMAWPASADGVVFSGDVDRVRVGAVEVPLVAVAES